MSGSSPPRPNYGFLLEMLAAANPCGGAFFRDSQGNLLAIVQRPIIVIEQEE